jgi:hypothetical protein
LENSPSKVAPIANPLRHFTSADAPVSAASRAWAAPLTTKLAPGRVWNVAVAARSELKSCAHAARPRSVRIASFTAHDLSVRKPNSLRVAVTVFAP